MLQGFCGFHTSVKECQRARAWQVTWMRASGFSRLRISAACCCFSSSTMEAKVTVEGRGGLPTQGLRGTGVTEGQGNMHGHNGCYKDRVHPPIAGLCAKTPDFPNHAPDIFTKKQFPIITLLTDNKHVCTLTNKTKKIYWPGITF